MSSGAGIHGNYVYEVNNQSIYIKKKSNITRNQIKKRQHNCQISQPSVQILKSFPICASSPHPSSSTIELPTSNSNLNTSGSSSDLGLSSVQAIECSKMVRKIHGINSQIQSMEGFGICGNDCGSSPAASSSN